MKLCLSALATNGAGNQPLIEEMFKMPCALESYAYATKNKWVMEVMKKAPFAILDSGAFTFMNGSKGEVDWLDYVNKYADFVNQHNIKHFIEVDVDSVTGYDAVKKFRKMLEIKTGRKPIPVWHVSRGIDEFKRHVDEYDYVAIGGIVTKEIKPKDHDQLFKLVRYAHAHGTKVHGLGFTRIKELPICGFDSVDSSSWASGGRFGHIYHYKNGTLTQHSKKHARVADYKEADLHNFRQWVELAKYAEINW